MSSSVYYSAFHPAENSVGAKGSAAFPDTEDGLTLFLTVQSSTVPTMPNGSGGDYSASGGFFVVLRGGTPVTSTFSVAGRVPNTNWININSSTGEYTVTDPGTNAASAVLRANIEGTNYDLTYSLSKSPRGIDGLSAFLTNESVSLFTYANGVVVSYSPATGSFKVFNGSTDISSSFSLSTVANPQGLSVTYTGQTYTITGGIDPSEENASLTIRATGSGDWAGIFFDKVFSLSISRGGYEIVSSLPGAGDPRRFEGSIVFLNTDGKLYRFVGSDWTVAVDGADIIAGTVTAAKMGVTDLSSITANIGTLTAGVIRNGADTFRVDATNGRTITQTGAFMKVTGTPFGSSNQFIEWYGPYFPNLISCTEANAVYYLKTDGSAYFGGNLSAGILKTAVQTSSLAADASVETGNYGSNGNTIQVVLSYYAYSESPESFYDATLEGRNAFNDTVIAWGATPDFSVSASKSVSASASIALDRSVNGGAFTNGVATLNITTGTETIFGVQPVPGDSAGYIVYTRTFSGSLTYTDPQTVAQNRNYRARITSRAGGILAYSLNQQQRVGIVSTE